MLKTRIYAKIWQATRSRLNFYRIHLLCFIFFPLFCALIFWASNGRFHIRFIDALFVCISAATGTGLSTIDLSSLTAWQQTIIVILEISGNQVFVSWIVVYIRRRYFQQHLTHVISAEVERTLTRKETYREESDRLTEMRSSGPNLSSGMPHVERKRTRQSSPKPIRKDMVRRMDVAPRPINPMGFPARTVTQEAQTQTAYNNTRPTLVRIPSDGLRRRSISSSRDRVHPHSEVGFGGFPGPADVISGVSSKLFPTLHRGMQRTLTIPRTATLVPQDQNVHALPHPDSPTRRIRYLSFIADVGKNSHFRHLTEEQMLELGGVEYRALNSLMWMTPLYYFGIVAISIVITAPYMALPKWKHAFLPPMQHRIISPTWFSVFQVIGAWANTGMALVDQNMVPFRTAYLIIAVLIVCVLAGNTAFPIFFRFTIWLVAKCFRVHSRTRDSLQFLLDHPRRCFISLFPSHQTWLLFFVLLLMNAILLGGDLILNIDNPATDAIPTGQRIALAFLSAAAVRSAGFQGVAVSALVPAVQVLYVIMMYIAIYPVAMSVRATNVYEEKSLGVFDSEEDLIEPENDEIRSVDRRVAIWGKYLMRHVRRQLSFDMWWLALSLFIICIIERHGLMDTAKSTWFNIFAVLFELVSGYGTVGLSLGIPNANYSLSGAFHTLSKLVICAVMLRGRHRGLPDALDRAVLLPREFSKEHVGDNSETSQSSAAYNEDMAEVSEPRDLASPTPTSGTSALQHVCVQDEMRDF